MTEPQNVVVYSGHGVELRLPLDSEHETVWATQAQIVDLFGIDQSGVSRHIRNVFRDAEVDADSNMQKLHTASSDRPVIINNALAAITLIVAMSDPKEKELMIALITRMLVDGPA